MHIRQKIHIRSKKYVDVKYNTYVCKKERPSFWKKFAEISTY